MGKGEKGRGGQGVAGWKGKEKLLRQSVAADSSCDGGKQKKKKKNEQLPWDSWRRKGWI